MTGLILTEHDMPSLTSQIPDGATYARKVRRIQEIWRGQAGQPWKPHVSMRLLNNVADTWISHDDRKRMVPTYPAKPFLAHCVIISTHEPWQGRDLSRASTTSKSNGRCMLGQREQSQVGNTITLLLTTNTREHKYTGSLSPKRSSVQRVNHPVEQSHLQDSPIYDHISRCDSCVYDLEGIPATSQDNFITDGWARSQPLKSTLQLESNRSFAGISDPVSLYENLFPSELRQGLRSVHNQVRPCVWPASSVLCLSRLSGGLKSRISHLRAILMDSLSHLCRPQGDANAEASKSHPIRLGGNSFNSKTAQGNQENHLPDRGGALDGQTNSDQKRRLGSREVGDDNFDDSGKDGVKAKARKVSRRGDSEQRRFACPFFKHDPRAYGLSRACAGPGWPNIHRVKEHVLRRHTSPPFQCSRCFQDCKSQSGKMDHLNQVPPCSPPSRPPKNETITGHQENLLRIRRRRDEFTTDEHIWYEMYGILFPEEVGRYPTTPYHEPDSSPLISEARIMSTFESILSTELPKRVQEQVHQLLEKHNLQNSTLLDEIPDIVASTLQDVSKIARETDGQPSREMQAPPSIEPGLEGFSHPNYQFNEFNNFVNFEGCDNTWDDTFLTLAHSVYESVPAAPE